MPEEDASAAAFAAEAAFQSVLADISTLITGRKRSSTVNWVSDFESMKVSERASGGGGAGGRRAGIDPLPLAAPLRSRARAAPPGAT